MIPVKHIHDIKGKIYDGFKCLISNTNYAFILLSSILSSKYFSIQPYLLPCLCSYEGYFLFQNHTKHQILFCVKLYHYFYLRFLFSFCICSLILLMSILIRGLLHLHKIKSFSLHFHPDFYFWLNLIYYLLTGK